MEIWGLLPFGVLVGMQHAFEADHLAAVAALSTDRSSTRSMALRGLFWGTGHTLALFIICGGVFLTGIALSARLEAGLELVVGLVLILLGANVLRQFFSERDATTTPDLPAITGTRPKKGGLLRPLFVGLLHGAAGSAALLLLVVTTTHSMGTALLYIALFGLGSIVGMTLLTLAAAYPLRILQKGTTWLNTAAMVVIGCVAMLIGARLAFASLFVLSP